MLIKERPALRASEITPERTYWQRREFLISAGTALVALAADGLDVRTASAAGARLAVTKRNATTSDPPTPYAAVTTYNNFYEFGGEKSDPAAHSKDFKAKPWSVVIEGACTKPGVYTFEDILKPHAIEERVYRHRCVEGWSMVVPWDGFALGELLKRFEPTGNAKFVEFTTIMRPDEMIGLRRLARILPWPYREGLRIDEAMHPLAFVAMGLYGEELPNQNGAPLRLVLPWKYGFKSIKSIVKIRFVETQPVTTWQAAAPQYYAFYSNVNPGPTYSTYRDQAKERRLGEFFMRNTLMFNGYADQVGSLYSGMDLRNSY
jgi:sulfoxide reductase catalytic subunit YedY